MNHLLLFMMHTISWVILLVTILTAGGVIYFRLWLRKLWNLGVENFFRKLASDEEFLERWIQKTKNIINPLTGSVFWAFAILFVAMGIADIVAVENSGGLLLSFGQILWILFAPFQMVIWAILENGIFIISSLTGMSKATTTNPAWLVIAYTVVYSVVTGGTFWFFFPWEDKLKIYPEVGTPEEVASIKGKNKFARNFIRSLLIVGIFLVVYVNGIFESTLLPMWGNPGIERVAEIFGHYTEQAMTIEVTPESTAMAPVTYGYDQTGKSAGTSWWVWALIFLGVIVVLFLVYWFVLRGKFSKGSARLPIADQDKIDVSSDDLEEPYDRLEAATGCYYNFLQDISVLSRALGQGKVAANRVDDVKKVLAKMEGLIDSLFSKLTTAKKVYDGFHEDFHMVELIVNNKIDKSGRFDGLVEHTRVLFINAAFKAIQNASKYNGWEMDIKFLKHALKQDGWVGDRMRQQITDAVKSAEQRFSN